MVATGVKGIGMVLQCVVRTIGAKIRNNHLYDPGDDHRAMVLIASSSMRGGLAATVEFGIVQWSVMAFLGIFGGAATFLLWSFALSNNANACRAICHDQSNHFRSLRCLRS